MQKLVGIVERSGETVTKSRLNRMLIPVVNVLTDRSVMWVTDQVGFACGITGNIDNNFNTQPIAKNVYRTVICDARIDNLDELLRRLNVQGNLSVPELLLLAYEKWGPECTQYIEGDFSIAIWDQRDQVLYLATDRFAVRPIYYALLPHYTVFATDQRSLLGELGNLLDLNSSKIMNFLLVDNKHQEYLESTFIQHIRLLPPASWMTVSSDKIRQERYWAPYDIGIQRRSLPETARELRSVFTESIERCLKNHASPVGLTLSGGLDSSSIACILKTVYLEPLYTFYADNGMSVCDESSYVTEVANHIQSIHFSVDGFTPLQKLDEAIAFGAQPSGMTNLMMNWAVYTQANTVGVNMMFTGLDGDTVLSHGRGRIYEWLKENQWDMLEYAVTNRIRSGGNTFDTIYRKYISVYLMALLVEKKYSTFLAAVRELKTRFSVSFVEIRKLLSECRIPQATTPAPNYINQNALDKHARYSKENLLLEQLNELEDHKRSLFSPSFLQRIQIFNWFANAHRIQNVHPFLNRNLVELCLTVPSEYKFSNNGVSRFLMREAMISRVPQAVLKRNDKIDFNFCLADMMLERDDQYIQDTLSTLSSPLAQYVELTEVRTLYQRMKKREKGYQYLAAHLYRILSLDIWLEWFQKEKVRNHSNQM